MTYQQPIITVPDIPDKQLRSTIKEYEAKGYQVQQRKRMEQWNYKSEKTEVLWTLKLKLNNPPPKAGRILVD